MKRPIEAVRREIDTLDREMLRLLRKRYALVLEAGSFKSDTVIENSPERQQQLIDGVRRHALELGFPPLVAEGTFAGMLGSFVTLEQQELERRQVSEVAEKGR